jgi:hypothetical protein
LRACGCGDALAAGELRRLLDDALAHAS